MGVSCSDNREPGPSQQSNLKLRVKSRSDKSTEGEIEDREQSISYEHHELKQGAPNDMFQQRSLTNFQIAYEAPGSNPLRRSQTVTSYKKTYSNFMNFPTELTGPHYDASDNRFWKLLDKWKPKTISEETENEQINDTKNSETDRADIHPKVLDEWNTFINDKKNEIFKKQIEQGTMDEGKFRDQFNIQVGDKEKCKWVDTFLLRKEAKSQKPPMPVLSSWDEMVALFGDEKNPKACAPVYWTEEVSVGWGDRARLIRVGVDVPAIWEIADAEQMITADLYITFTWQVQAKRDDIWDNVKRDFKVPVWKILLRSGKFITNLKKWDVLDDNLSCGNEERGRTTIIQRVTMTADFSQEFELSRFPFDEQTIGWTIRYWLIPYSFRINENTIQRRGRLIFYEDIKWNCRVKNKALKPQDEWTIIPEGQVYDKLKFISTVTDRSMDPKSGRVWPEISFSFKVKRNPDFMLWNVALPITLIVYFGLFGNGTAFYNDFDRTSFTAALLFTIFSIKNNVQYALSKVGYSTTLDTYILLSQGMVILQGMCGVMFSHFATDTLRNEDVEELNDYMLPLVLGICGFLIWTYITFQFWKGRSLTCKCPWRYCEDTDSAV